MPNHEMLEIVMKHIETHPDTHDQQVWGDINECGTTACFAGWTMLLNGYAMKRINGTRGTYDVVFLRPNGHAVDDESGEAAQLLGLKVSQASHMFLNLTTREELREYIDGLSE